MTSLYNIKAFLFNVLVLVHIIMSKYGYVFSMLPSIALDCKSEVVSILFINYKKGIYGFYSVPW